MRKFNFNHGTLSVDGNDIRFELPKGYIHDGITDDDQKRLNDFGGYKGMGLPCLVQVTEDMKLAMEFKADPNYMPFEHLKINGDANQRLRFAEELVEIGDFFSKNHDLVTVFEPNNFLVNEQGSIKIIYRGIQGKMPAKGYERDNIFDQIQRLILVSLSNASIDQLRSFGNEYAAKDKVIKEYKRTIMRVIRCKNIEELRDTIYKELQELVTDTVQDENKKMFNLKLNNILERKKEKNSANHSDKKAVTSETQRSIFFSKPLVVGISVLVVLCTLSYMLGRSQASEVKASQDNTRPSQTVINGLRLAAIQQYEKATEWFEDVNYHQLDKSDQKAVLFSYLLSGDAQKAIDLEPEFAESVVSYYLATDSIKEIRKLRSDEPVVQFEKAYLEGDLNQVLKLKDQVVIDGRREQMIVNVYLKKKDFEGALSYAKQLGNEELIKKVQQAESEGNKGEEPKRKDN